MRVAILADIHGNLPAFEAVLAEIAAEPVDRVVCLGDVAAFGPQPREVIARLRRLGCPVVMGNADAELLDPQPPEGAPNEDFRRLRELDAWADGLLSPDDKDFLRSFQPTVALDLGNGATLLCYHGSPRSFNDRLLPSTDAATLDGWLGEHPAALYAGGHTHLQMLARHRKSLVLNPGSVGLPYDTVPVPPDTSTRNPAWAEYAIVEAGGAGRLRVDLRRTPFDVAALLRAARDSGMPHAGWWSADWDVPPATPA